jgi:protein TonB
MATLAATRSFPQEARRHAPQRPAPVVVESVPEPIVRTQYQPSRRSGPIAGLASAGVILAGMAALATLNVVAQKKAATHLTVVEARELDITPPPPSAPVVAAAPKIAAPAGPAIAAPAPSAEPVEGGDLSSQVLSARPPAYPVDARRRREQGTVKLLVLVGPDGRVSDIELASSSGSQALDRAALSAVKRWRWAPQKKSGAPAAVRGYVTIPFVLTN